MKESEIGLEKYVYLGRDLCGHFSHLQCVSSKAERAAHARLSSAFCHCKVACSTASFVIGAIYRDQRYHIECIMYAYIGHATNLQSHDKLNCGRLVLLALAMEQPNSSARTCQPAQCLRSSLSLWSMHWWSFTSKYCQRSGFLLTF